MTILFCRHSVVYKKTSIKAVDPVGFKNSVISQKETFFAILQKR